MRMALIAASMGISLHGLAAENLDRELLDAVWRSNIPEATRLISLGANPNNADIPDKDCRGQPSVADPAPVLAAYWNQTTSALKFLIENGGANIDIRSKAEDCVGGRREGRTPLLAALSADIAQNALFLLRKGADPNFMTLSSGESSLRIALEKNSLLVMDELWPRVSPAVVNNAFESLFEYSYANEKVISYLPKFLAHGADVNHIAVRADGILTSLITTVIAHGDVDTLRFILDRGADPNLKVGSGNPLTALNRASTETRLDKARLLLQYGAVPTVLAFKSAVSQRNYELSKFFVDHGLNVNEPLDGKPLLCSKAESYSNWLAAIDGEQLEFLVRSGVNIHAYCGNLNPILQVAPGADNFAKPKLPVLIRAGADLNSRDLLSLDTPLMRLVRNMSAYQEDRLNLFLRSSTIDYSLKNTYSETTLFVMIFGINWNQDATLSMYESIIARSRKVINEPARSWSDGGITPLHLIILQLDQLRSRPEVAVGIAKALLANGADREIKDDRGRTPLTLARAQSDKPGLKEIIELLETY